jgi:hypothetical protein
MRLFEDGMLLGETRSGPPSASAPKNFRIFHDDLAVGVNSDAMNLPTISARTRPVENATLWRGHDQPCPDRA